MLSKQLLTLALAAMVLPAIGGDAYAAPSPSEFVADGETTFYLYNLGQQKFIGIDNVTTDTKWDSSIISVDDVFAMPFVLTQSSTAGQYLIQPADGSGLYFAGMNGGGTDRAGSYYAASNIAWGKNGANFYWCIEIADASAKSYTLVNTKPQSTGLRFGNNGKYDGYFFKGVALAQAADEEFIFVSEADYQEYCQGVPRLYQCSFNDDPTYFAPFRVWNAVSPNYIKVVDNALEFYYDKDSDTSKRVGRGCEIVCDFSTVSEGWYGYRLYLPEGGFPHDTQGSIITQFFNLGRRNSWAAHLSVEGEDLILSYRRALVDPTVRTVGTLRWNEWQNVVVYFRVGRNNKGCMKVWLGNTLVESNPTLECNNINLGFAENWTDDTHFDPTPYEYNDATYSDAISGKWGLYVSDTVSRTMRFDDLSVLEGNPEGAFSLVCPTATDALGLPVAATEEAADDAAYDIYGRKVGPGYKGLVIKNGRKFIVR